MIWFVDCVLTTAKEVVARGIPVHGDLGRFGSLLKGLPIGKRLYNLNIA
jgi:hypothetical protein